MPYVQKPSSVQMGTEKVTLANGQVIELPRAFVNRMRFDLDVSNQTTLYARGRESDMYYKAQPGMYTAYGGLDEFLKRINKVYAGQGQAVQYSQPYQQQQKLYGEYQKQQQLKASTGASRKISMTAGGQVLSDTGQVVREDQMSAHNPAINREQRKLQGSMMADLQEFKQIGQNSTVSNVPIVVTRSSDPDVRSSMAMHLKKLGEVR